MDQSESVSHSQDAKMERNAIIGYKLLSLDFMAMLVPVISIIWLQAALSFGEILLLQGIFTIAIMLVEVPSGALSDSWLGRKNTAILAFTIVAVSMAVYAFAESFWQFAMAEMLAGIALGIGSGNGSALLYDTLKSQHHEKEFQSIVIRVSTYSFIVGAAANIIGGILGSINLRLPLILLSIIHAVIVIYLCVKIKEPARIRAKGVLQATKKASISMITKSSLLILAIFTIGPGVLSTIVFWAYQQILVSMDVGSFELGLLTASSNIMASLGSLVLRRYTKRFQSVWLFPGLLIASAGYSFIISSTQHLVILVLTIFASQLIRGIIRPLTESYCQNYLNSDERATFVSIDSFKNAIIYSMIAGIQHSASLLVTLHIIVIFYVSLSIVCSLVILSMRIHRTSRPLSPEAYVDTSAAN